MLITPLMGFTPPRRNIILTTRRIIIRTFHGTVTTAARITTASKPRVNPPPHRRCPKLQERYFSRLNGSIRVVSTSI
jgi:hypothetical protein